MVLLLLGFVIFRLGQKLPSGKSDAALVVGCGFGQAERAVRAGSI